MTTRVPTRVAFLIVVGTVLLVVGGVALAVRSTAAGEATRLRVEHAQTTFRKFGVDSYTIDLERSCFCDTNGLTFTLTIEKGELTHIAVRGFTKTDPRSHDVAEWDHAELPDRYEWLDDWGPIDRALASIAETVDGRRYTDGPAAVYSAEGEHKLVTKLSVDPQTGVLRSYFSNITNTFDAQVSFQWSNFRPLK